MPKCNGKKYTRFGPENTDAPGASPRRYGAPIAIVLYYLNRDFRYRGIAMRPRPNGDRTGARGADDCQSYSRGQIGTLPFFKYMRSWMGVKGMHPMGCLLLWGEMGHPRNFLRLCRND